MNGQIMITMSYPEFEKALEDIVDKVLDRRFEPLKKMYEEKLVTRDEVLRVLKISAPTLWRMEQRGDLVPVRIGRKVMYKESEITQIIQY